MGNNVQQFSNDTALLLLDFIGRLENPDTAPLAYDGGPSLIVAIKPTNAPVFCGMWTNGESDANQIIWIAFRGTKTSQEWTQDLETNQVPLQAKWMGPGLRTLGQEDANVLVHKGFLDMLQLFLPTITVQLGLVDPNQTATVVIGGHSLGAAVATLCGYQFVSVYQNKLCTYGFASPRVGNGSFAFSVNNLGYALFRVSNAADIITDLPPAIMFNLTGNGQPYEYAHAGTNESFQLNWGSWKNNHLIPVYIYALEGNCAIVGEAFNLC